MLEATIGSEARISRTQRNPAVQPSSAATTVDDVIVSPEPPNERLSKGRKSAEAGALLALSHTLAHAPDHAVQQLVNPAMKLAQAQSAGLSVEDMDAGQVILRWIATAGEFAATSTEPCRATSVRAAPPWTAVLRW